MIATTLVIAGLVGSACGATEGIGTLPPGIDDGVNVLAVPFGAPAFRMTIADVIDAAGAASSAEEQPQVVARRWLSRARNEAVWIVLYGADNVQSPCGGPPDGSLGLGFPRRMCSLTHAGPIIDDRTGDQLYWIVLGWHVDDPGAVLQVREPDGGMAWFRVFGTAAEAYPDRPQPTT
jgi:hypothetical protein